MLLKESISSVVYHFTSINAANKIISSGHFNLHPTYIHDSDNTTKYYYLSTTRSRVGEYHLSNNNNNVGFKIDGNKINQRYKGHPINYWSNPNTKLSTTTDEMEDRIFSNQDTLPISDIILEITVLADLDSSNNINPTLIKNLYSYCKKNKIPFYVYDDHKSFLHNIKKNAWSHEKIVKLPSKLSINGKSNDRDNKELYAFISAGMLPYTSLNDKTKAIVNDIIKNSDSFYRIKSDIINITHSENRSTMKTITQLIKKYKTKNISDLYDSIIAKIKKEKNDYEEHLRYEQSLRTYENRKEEISHLLDAILNGEELNRDLYSKDDDIASMQIHRDITLLQRLNLITDRMQLLYFDEYGLLDSVFHQLIPTLK